MKSISLNISLSSEVLALQHHTANYFSVKGWNSKQHNNPLDELHIILSRPCQLEVDNEQYHLAPGSVVLVRAGKFHGPPKLQREVERCSFPLSTPQGGFGDHQLELLSHDPVRVSDDVISLCHQLDADVEQAAPYYQDMLAAINHQNSANDQHKGSAG